MHLNRREQPLTSRTSRTSRARAANPFVAAPSAPLRVLVLGLLLFVGAWSLGAPVTSAFLLAVAAALAMCVERLATRRETSQVLLVNSFAANREGKRAAEAQLLSLELGYDRTRSVLEALREGVVVVDSGGEVVLANPVARRAMQEPALQPLGCILWDVLTPELGQRAREAWQSLAITANDSPDALQQIRYSSIPCRNSVYDLTAVQAKSSRTGQDFGTVFLLVDSTRSHELQRLKDRFLSSVSHELRTPLTNICASAEILRAMVPDGNAGEEWPEFVRVVHEEGVQLSRLVDGVFDFLQLESGEAVFDNQVIEVSSVVSDALRNFAAAAAQRGIDFEVVEQGSAAQVLVDPARLERVCRNLLDNALKFTPTGGRVRLSTSVREQGWELRVEDSGPGVPVEARTAVFEKFHQLPDHLTDKPSGTGLGLATSRAIVSRFGGLIWCEDSPLGGAGFVVLLPLVGQNRLVGAGSSGGF